MSAKTTIILMLKLIVLTVLLFLCYSVASIMSGVTALPATADRTPPPTGDVPAPADPGASALALLAASFLQAVVFTTIILRSRWRGWKLAGAVFLAFYGLGTVVPQIDSIVFLQHRIPPGVISKIFIMGAITAGLFSPLAVLIMGQMRTEANRPAPRPRSVMPAGEWAWKLAAMAVVYVILYFIFGYFIAWKNPAVRAYYGGNDPGFFSQMAGMWATLPWLFALQAFRGLLWAAFALPVIRTLEGSRWEVASAVALLFTVWSSLLLVPNPYMPEAVRRVHLVETASEDFIFGWLVGWLLSRRHSIQS